MGGKSDTLFTIGLGLVALLIGYFVGSNSYANRIRYEAVRAGAARYVADENGRSQFEWIAIAPAK